MDSANNRRRLLGAYIDDSLEPAQRLAVEALLSNELQLRHELDDMRRIRAAVQVSAQRYAAPPRLRAQLVAQAQPTRRRWRYPAGWLAAGWSAVFDWRPAAALVAAAALAFWTANLVVLPVRGNGDLMQAAVESHLRATAGPRLVDIASTRRGDVQPWLSERLAFAVPVADSRAVHADLVGARLDTLQGRAVAAVVYRLRDHVVNTFIWPATDDAAAINSASIAGLNVTHWSRGGLRYCVVSDLPKPQLVAFAQSLAAEDESR
jgi:anti-sigma factor RsiW